MKKLAIYLVLAVAISLFSFNHAYAIGAPTPVCPAVPYGQTGPYHSTRIPTFNWTTISGATWYQIYLSYAHSTGTALLKQWVKGVNSWTFDADFDLHPGYEYSWWVRAYDGSSGSWSNRADFIVGHLKIVSIGPSSFVPSKPENLCSYPGGTYLAPEQDYGSSDADNIWTAPLILPDFSEIEYLKMCYWNNGSVSSASECYVRQNNYTSESSFEYLLESVSGTTNGNYKGDVTAYLTTPNRRVRNTSNHYCVNVYLPSTSNWLIRVEIGYWD